MTKIEVQERVLDRLAAIVGERHVLTAEADKAPYLTEPRGYYHGRTPAVVRPGSAEEIAAILRLANETGTPIVPQGGNTGLVGGQIPDEGGREVVVTTERLDAIRAVDPKGGTIVAEAGVALERLQAAADEADMLFPLSLASQGSCRIGGNISTNAGGTGVLAYGNTRSLVLGLEVVLPTGETWNGLRGLYKDNTGYDLKQLFIGAEGTLGIVTAAVLKLFPKPRGQAVAFVGLQGPDEALQLFRMARDRAGNALTAFEIMPRVLMEMLVKHLPDARDPLAEPHPWYVLIEISSGRSEADATELVEGTLADALEAGLVADAVLAASLEQAGQFWRLRHGASEIQKHEGGSIKHDVSIPVEAVPEFIARAGAAGAAIVPGVRVVPFGHMGDGNIHLNFAQPPGMDKQAYMARAPEVHRAVYAIVAEMGGSIAAEHGIGRYKRQLLTTVKSEIELDMMRRIKRAFDPNGILNPGRVLQPKRHGTMGLPDWHYDDLRQVGLDFSSEEEVGTYDARQQGAAEREAARLRDLGLEPGHVLADIGCGTGILACEAARMCSFVHAVDISHPMLRAAETRASALGLHNMAFHNAGFLSFELDDGMLDLVTSQFALHHLPDFWKSAALVRMQRMLKPGGKVFLRDVVFTCDPDQIPDAVEGWIGWMRENSGYEREEVACHVREEHSTFAWVMEGLIERAGLRLLSAAYENEVYGTYIAERPAGS